MPFAGQKRNLLAPLRELISELPASTVFVDLFGGSGLLSRTCKDLHPTAKVVYNDYDNYCERLAHIAETEELRIALLPIVMSNPKRERCKNVDEIVDVVRQHLAATGYVDWITLSVWVLFSNNYAYSIEELRTTQLYNAIVRYSIPVNSVAQYLDGLDIVREDWRELLARYRDDPNALFLLDPPYLGTRCDGYQDSTWNSDDYAELLASIPNNRYIYFTSSKLDFVPMLQRLVPNSPFTGASCYTRSSYCGGGRNIEAMYYKL